MMRRPLHPQYSVFALFFLLRFATSKALRLPRTVPDFHAMAGRGTYVRREYGRRQPGVNIRNSQRLQRWGVPVLGHPAAACCKGQDNRVSRALQRPVTRVGAVRAPSAQRGVGREELQLRTVQGCRLCRPHCRGGFSSLCNVPPPLMPFFHLVRYKIKKSANQAGIDQKIATGSNFLARYAPPQTHDDVSSSIFCSCCIDFYKVNSINVIEHMCVFI